MLPDRVSNPGPLTYESGALPIALCSPASIVLGLFWKGKTDFVICSYSREVKTHLIVKYGNNDILNLWPPNVLNIWTTRTIHFPYGTNERLMVSGVPIPKHIMILT